MLTNETLQNGFRPHMEHFDNVWGGIEEVLPSFEKSLPQLMSTPNVTLFSGSTLQYNVQLLDI